LSPWPPRRVVTGHDQSGKSVFVSDGAPPVVREVVGGDAAFAEIWNTAAMPAPIAATEPDPTVDRPLRVPPDANGTIIRLVEHRPGSVSPMHRTETVDYGICVRGELYLVLDDSEVRLTPGDVVVQRGTDHRWENRSDEAALMAFVLVDGAFTEELRASLGTSELMDDPVD
jgi:quercetin dioxygenase-like cupin family protein